MQVITGRIRKLLRDSAGAVTGFSLDTGLDVRFPADRAACVLEVVAAGSHVEIHARMQNSFVGHVYADTRFVTNLDARQSIDLLVPSTHRPEALDNVALPPHTTAPLVPSLQSIPEPSYLEHAVPQPLATRKNVADEMERAYDVLHRIQAMLAYLKMMKRREPTIHQYLDEAQHTYVQALSRYQARDFEGARELAEACSNLSRAVEILISRTFHSKTDYSRLQLLSPASEHVPARGEVGATQYDLDGIERLLTRIHWVTENGTLPSEDRAQVQKLSSWSESLHRQARHLLESGAMDDAIEFMQAADAAACSAEHLCKRCYVARSRFTVGCDPELDYVGN